MEREISDVSVGEFPPVFDPCLRKWAQGKRVLSQPYRVTARVRVTKLIPPSR